MLNDGTEALLADCPTFSFLRVIGMVSLFSARSLAGNWTRWRVARAVASCIPRLRHTTLGRAPQDKWSHSQQTDIHASGGIRTLNPSMRAAVDARLRPRCYWDRPFWHLVDSKYSSEFKFYGSTVQHLEMFVRQLCTNVRIRCTKDGLGGGGFITYESRMPKVEARPIMFANLFAWNYSGDRGPHVGQPCCLWCTVYIQCVLQLSELQRWKLSLQ